MYVFVWSLAQRVFALRIAFDIACRLHAMQGFIAGRPLKCSNAHLQFSLSVISSDVHYINSCYIQEKLAGMMHSFV